MYPGQETVPAVRGLHRLLAASICIATSGDSNSRMSAIKPRFLKNGAGAELSAWGYIGRGGRVYHYSSYFVSIHRCRSRLFGPHIRAPPVRETRRGKVKGCRSTPLTCHITSLPTPFSHLAFWTRLPPFFLNGHPVQTQSYQTSTLSSHLTAIARVH